jgi:hypothetical protein
MRTEKLATTFSECAARLYIPRMRTEKLATTFSECAARL